MQVEAQQAEAAVQKALIGTERGDDLAPLALVFAPALPRALHGGQRLANLLDQRSVTAKIDRSHAPAFPIAEPIVGPGPSIAAAANETK